MSKPWIFCFFLTVLLGTTFAIDPTLSQPPKKISTWGEVTDSSGNVVASVNIEILPMFEAEGEHLNLSSNVSGRLSLNPIKRPSDDYVIWKHPKYATWGKGHINVDKFGPDQLFEIKLTDPLPFKGKIVDSKGKGIPSANISVDADLPCRDHTHAFSGLSSALSDSKGDFTITNLPPQNTFRLKATHPKFTMTKRVSFEHKKKSDTSGSSNLVLTMSPSQSLRIYLLEPNGKGVANKKVFYGFSSDEITRFGDVDHNLSQFNIESDDRGNILIQGPQKGFLHLRLDFPSHEEKQVLNLPLHPWKDQRITLKPKAGLTFQVISRMSRKPVEGATVRVYYKDPKQKYETSQRGTSDKKGSATLFIPTVKKAVAQSWADGYLPKEENLQLLGKKVFLMELEKGEPSKVTLSQPLPHGGSALIPNRPVTIRHSFYPSEKKQGSSRRSRGRESRKVELTSNEKGELKIEGFHKGDDLLFKVKGYVAKTVKAPTPGEPLDLLLEPGSQLSFRVHDQDGAEIKRPRFYLKTASHRDSISSKYLKKTRQHQLDPLAEGKHKILITEYKHQETNIDVEVGPGKSREFEVVLQSKPEITIRLKGLKDPKKPGDVRVQFKDSRGHKQGARVTRIKEEEPPSYKCQPYQKADGLREMVVTVENYLPVTLPVDFKKDTVYEVELESGLSLSAIISGPDGTPVEGADVSVNETAPWRSHHQETNAEGKVNLGGLREGNFRVEVQKKGFAPFVLESQEFKKDQPPFQWTLNKGLDLNVNVADQNGLPLEDVEVLLFTQSQYGGLQQYNIDGEWPLSDASGQVLFSNLTEGSYQLKGSSEEFGLGESQPFIFKNGDNKVVTLTIKEGLKISGVIIDELNNPISGVTLRAHQMMTRSSGQNNEAESDDDGRFTLSNLSEGVYSVSLQHQEYESTQPPQVKAGEKDLKLKMTTIKKWRVQILQPDGKPTTKASLHRFIPQWGGISSLGRPELDGDEYILTSRKLGGQRNENMEFQIIAKSDGFGPAKSETLTQATMTDLTLHLTSSINRTIIVKNEEGGPVADAVIRANQMIKGKEIRTNQRSENLSDEAGQVLLEGLSEGPYRIHVEHGDYAAKSKDLDIKEPEGTVEVTLAKGGKVSGKVLDHEQNPQQGVSLWVAGENGEYLNRGETVTGPEGAFTISNLAEGSYLLQARNKQHSWSRDIEIKHPFSVVNGEDVEVTLQLKAPEPTGKLVGTLKEGSFFQSVSLSGREHRAGEQHQAALKGQTFSFKNIPVGKYTLTLMGMKGYSTRNVLIEEDKTTEISIGDKKAYKVTGKIKTGGDTSFLMGMAMILKKNRPDSMNLHGNPEAVVGTGKIHGGLIEMEIEEHGTYDLMISVSGARNEQATFLFENIVVLDQEITDLGVLTRPLIQKQTLTVLGSNGEPLQGAYASIFQNGIPVRNNQWVSDGKGVIQLEREPDSHYSLIVRHKDYAPFAQDVSHANPFEVTLSLGYDVSISLPEFPNTKVGLLDSNKKPLLYQLQYFRTVSLLLDSQGNVKWTKMPEGEYRIRLYKKGGEMAFSESFRVGPGSPNDIRLVLEP